MHIVVCTNPHASSPDEAQRNPGARATPLPDSVSLHPGYAVYRFGT
jgi:hypothetical protein